MKFIQSFWLFLAFSIAFGAEKPLDLAAISAKDTASFETYSQRLALINDSISASYRAIEAAKKNSESAMPSLEPKGEFEKQSEFDARQQKWHNELAQRIEKDARPFTSRLEQLEKAKSKVMENQASLYGSVDIKTIPSAVSIWIDREEIGASPALYNLLIPGTVKIFLRKEGYNPYDTTLQVLPGAKLKINVELEERSIFSQENEINFARILSKDTTVQGYEARIKIVEARIVQVNEEIKGILLNFPEVYPPLEVQRPGESAGSFKKRHDAWSREGVRQYGELQKKHEAYKSKLERSINVLKDYIIVTHSAVISEPALGAKLYLGTYDAEKEAFEFVAQDTATVKSPFIFSGKVVVPRDVAKNLNRSAPGFAAVAQFINYPFKTDSASVNLAMSKLLLSNGGKDLRVEGSFGEIERYKTMDGYGAWKLHADSLLSGALKVQGLDYNYAMGKAAAKKVAAETEESNDSGFGWRGWTRILTFTAAAGLGGVAVFKHFEADKRKGEVKDLFEKREQQRNIYAGAAGGCALIGILTFIF
jgi:hypothetical protein